MKRSRLDSSFVVAKSPNFTVLVIHALRIFHVFHVFGARRTVFIIGIKQEQNGVKAPKWLKVRRSESLRCSFVPLSLPDKQSLKAVKLISIISCQLFKILRHVSKVGAQPQNIARWIEVKGALLGRCMFHSTVLAQYASETRDKLGETRGDDKYTNGPCGFARR